MPGDSLFVETLEIEYLETVKRFPGMSRQEFADNLIKMASPLVAAEIRTWLAITVLPRVTEVKDASTRADGATAQAD